VNQIHVLLAEDHETVRRGLRLLIDGQSDMCVVQEVGDGRAAVAQATEHKPDVVVLDLSMPQLNGLEAAKRIKEAAPATAIVALTRHAEDAYVQALLAAGAVGYVLKQSAPAELLEAIRAAARGAQHLDSSLAQAAARLRPRGARSAQTGATITERETEVLRLMALGHSNKDIATALEIAVKTVEVHKANAMRKLGLHGRTDVVKYAALQGWLAEP
jgi:DNA-binding NarL/FixJ family response regulator